MHVKNAILDYFTAELEIALHDMTKTSHHI